MLQWVAVSRSDLSRFALSYALIDDGITSMARITPGIAFDKSFGQLLRRVFRVDLHCFDTYTATWTVGSDVFAAFGCM